MCRNCSGSLFLNAPDGRTVSIRLPAGEAEYLLTPANVVTTAQIFLRVVQSSLNELFLHGISVCQLSIPLSHVASAKHHQLPGTTCGRVHTQPDRQSLAECIPLCIARS